MFNLLKRKSYPCPIPASSDEGILPRHGHEGPVANVCVGSAQNRLDAKWFDKARGTLQSLRVADEDLLNVVIDGVSIVLLETHR